jgi:hypothetical protein
MRAHPEMQREYGSYEALGYALKGKVVHQTNEGGYVVEDDYIVDLSFLLRLSESISNGVTSLSSALFPLYRRRQKQSHT